MSPPRKRFRIALHLGLPEALAVLPWTLDRVNGQPWRWWTLIPWRAEDGEPDASVAWLPPAKYSETQWRERLEVALAAALRGRWLDEQDEEEAPHRPVLVAPYDGVRWRGLWRARTWGLERGLDVLANRLLEVLVDVALYKTHSYVVHVDGRGTELRTDRRPVLLDKSGHGLRELRRWVPELLHEVKLGEGELGVGIPLERLSKMGLLNSDSLFDWRLP